LVTLRLRASMRSPQPTLRAPDPRRVRSVSEAYRAPVVFENKKIMATICDRDSLQLEKKHSGPAIVTEYSATTVVPRGKRFWVDQGGNLLIDILR